MKALLTALQVKSMFAKAKVSKLLKSERGEANIVAIIIVIAIVVALAIVFRESIGNLFNSIWNGIMGNVPEATNKY